MNPKLGVSLLKSLVGEETIHEVYANHQTNSALKSISLTCSPSFYIMKGGLQKLDWMSRKYIPF